MYMKKKGRILVVDDNEEVLIALKLYLFKHFEIVDTEKNPNRIPVIFSQSSYDVVILDMNFSSGVNTGNEGLYWLKEIQKLDPNAIVVLMTAYGDIQLAVKGIKKGAVDFVTKPWENEKMLATVESAFQLRQSKLEIDKLKDKQQLLIKDINKQYTMFSGPSKTMKAIFNTINKVSATDANILILGENGTGKELIAREIHNRSNRRNEMFVTIDMAALPESLFESELFGYDKGSFTDAKENKPGRFEVASGGTLFLDEIGNLSLPMQAKILTVIQTRQITRIGSVKPIPIDIRLISATNLSLYKMVETQTFREDLLYRINTIQIELPPLRNRVEDIPGLVDFFLRIYERKYKKQGLKLHSVAYDKLSKYNWPGNIRELEHVIEKAIILSDSNSLSSNDFQFYSTMKKVGSKKKVFSLEENENILIREVLKECNGNLSDSAIQLGITRATLYRKLKKYDI